jgi:hypothetical protein
VIFIRIFLGSLKVSWLEEWMIYRERLSGFIRDSIGWI